MKLPKNLLEEMSFRIKKNSNKCLRVTVNDAALIKDKQCRVLTFAFSPIIKKKK
jgi:hypothetical protein